MAKRKIAVLVMAYGTPHTLDEVEAYYTHIRRGRKPSEEALADLVARYEAIGGCSPLFARTLQQVKALEDQLNQQDQDIQYTAYLGMKHISPFIEEAVEQMAQDGIKEAVGLVLTPHYSTMSVGSYLERAQESCQAHGIKLHAIHDWYRLKEFIDTLALRLQNTLIQLNTMPIMQQRVLFSAHSLPKRILDMRDPYPQQLKETCELVAQRTSLPVWSFAWQSAGKSGEEWLGPDLLTMLDQLAAEGVKGVVSCPIGFVSDHLEILYDLDIEAKQHANQLGITWLRTPSLNADSQLITGLANMIMNRIKEG